MGYQSVIVDLYLPEEITDSSLARMTANFDIVTDSGVYAAGTSIFQYATYTDANGDLHSVSCAMTVGEQDSVVENYFGQTSMTIDNNWGNTIYEQNSAEKRVDTQAADRVNRLLQTTTTTSDWSVEQFCGTDYPDFCVQGYPDFVAICDDKYAFPADYFADTSVLQVCDIDYEYACSYYPELCEIEGTFSSDFCGYYPEMCDTASTTYNACTADLYSCLADPNFSLCGSFPEVCGYTADFEVPFFRAPSRAGADSIVLASGYEVHTCKAYLEYPVGDLTNFFEELNYLYDAGI